MTNRLAEDLDFSRRNLRQDDSDATNAMTRHVKFIFSAKLFHDDSTLTTSPAKFAVGDFSHGEVVQTSIIHVLSSFLTRNYHVFFRATIAFTLTRNQPSLA